MKRKGEVVLFDTVEAGDYLGFAPCYLSQLRSYKRGPAFIKQGRRVFYPVNSLDAYATTNGLEVDKSILIGVTEHEAA